MTSYDVGALVKVSTTFTVGGVLTDPTTIVCTVRDPTGALTTPTVVRDSVGAYHANVDLTNATPGAWRYRWAGTGTCQAAEEATFYVEETLLTG